MNTADVIGSPAAFSVVDCVVMTRRVSADRHRSSVASIPGLLLRVKVCSAPQGILTSKPSVSVKVGWLLAKGMGMLGERSHPRARPTNLGQHSVDSCLTAALVYPEGHEWSRIAVARPPDGKQGPVPTAGPRMSVWPILCHLVSDA